MRVVNWLDYQRPVEQYMITGEGKGSFQLLTLLDQNAVIKISGYWLDWWENSKWCWFPGTRSVFDILAAEHLDSPLLLRCILVEHRLLLEFVVEPKTSVVGRCLSLSLYIQNFTRWCHLKKCGIGRSRPSVVCLPPRLRNGRGDNGSWCLSCYRYCRRVVAVRFAVVRRVVAAVVAIVTITGMRDEMVWDIRLIKWTEHKKKSRMQRRQQQQQQRQQPPPHPTG